VSDAIRVVHVDDEPDFAELTGTFLERESDQIEVTTARSASEGLDCIDDIDPDCVVSDYDMPGRDGIDFLEAVREDHEDLPFILFTGKGSETIAADAISAGATDYIQKEGGTGQYAVLANRIENVVERYRAHKRSVRADRRRRQTLRRITDGYVEMDADLTVTDVNEQTLAMIDLDREDIVGQNYRDLTDGESDTSLAAYEGVLETGETTTIEAKSDINPGRWVQERIFPAEDGDGIFVYSRDVTQRKEREQRLRETTRRLEGLLDSVQAVIWMLDAEDRFILVNENFRQVFGLDADTEISGIRPEELLGGDGSFAEDDRRARGTGEPVEVEHEVTVDGDDRVYLARITPLFDDDGAVFATAGAAVEITERKERERTVTALHSAAQTIAVAEDVATVYETLVDTAENVLAFDLVAVDLRRDGHLVQEAWELQGDSWEYYERTSLEDDDTYAVRAYNRQETIVVDDLRESEITPADPGYRSALTVPIGEFGTFQAVSSNVGGFDEHDREFAELLVDHARVKLAQLEDQ
jgi:PAS domain S-box-containing protein